MIYLWYGSRDRQPMIIAKDLKEVTSIITKESFEWNGSSGEQKR